MMQDMILEAKKKRAEIIIFPNYAFPVYLLGDTWVTASLLGEIVKHGETRSLNHPTVFVSYLAMWPWIGIKPANDGRVRKYNACFVAWEGKLWGDDVFPYPFRIKTLHPNYREFDDSRHFFSLSQLAAELGEKVENLLAPRKVSVRGKIDPLGLSSV
jgi:NAD+ synthase (glutamine-hydrolysing)